MVYVPLSTLNPRRFNVHRNISYKNIIHIRDNIYEAEAEARGDIVSRLVTWKVVDRNDKELVSYEMAEDLDKEHVLVGYDSFELPVSYKMAEDLDKEHSYEEPEEPGGRRVIVYERHQSLQDWLKLKQHQVVIGGRLNQELISIIWDLLKAIQYLVPLRKLEGGFDMHNVVVVKGRGKITGLWDDSEGQNLEVIRGEIASVLENIFSCCYRLGLERTQIEDFGSLIAVLRKSDLPHDHVFRIIHRHPLLLTHSCRVVFGLLAYRSIDKHNNRTSQSLGDYEKFLYDCSKSRWGNGISWTQWVKYNNRPNYCSQELKRTLARRSTPYSDSPWCFFRFMRNFVAHRVVNAEDLDEEFNLIWPGFLGMIFEMLLEFQVVLLGFD